MHIDALSLAPSLRTHMRTLGDEARIAVGGLPKSERVRGEWWAWQERRRQTSSKMMRSPA